MAENLKMNQHHILAIASAYVFRGVPQIGFECHLNIALKRYAPLSGQLKLLFTGPLKKEIM